MEKSISYQHEKLLCFLTLQDVQQVAFHQLPKLDSFMDLQNSSNLYLLMR